MIKMDEIERIRAEKIKKLLEKVEGDKLEIKIDVSDDNFEEKVVEQSKKNPVVVDFWAQWCMPCLMITPILEKFVEEHNGKFVLAKVNVDEARGAAQRYGIMSIPSVKMFKDGKVVDEFVGALPEPMVKEWLNKNLG